MTLPEPMPEPTLQPRRSQPEEKSKKHSFGLARGVTIAVSILLILLLTAFVALKTWTQHALRQALPQIDDQLAVGGLTAPVTVQRDAHGVPHIRAASR